MDETVFGDEDEVEIVTNHSYPIEISRFVFIAENKEKKFIVRWGAFCLKKYAPLMEPEKKLQDLKEKWEQELLQKLNS